MSESSFSRMAEHGMLLVDLTGMQCTQATTLWSENDEASKPSKIRMSLFCSSTNVIYDSFVYLCSTLSLNLFVGRMEQNVLHELSDFTQKTIFLW